MLSSIAAASFLKDAWDVLVLFLIPIGGGIPAGVVLAQGRGLSWLVMMFLYFISDVILACIFEPIMLLFLKLCRKFSAFHKLRMALSQSTGQLVSRYGIKPGPLTLVWITFGTDPMTGRSVAKAAGHGFLTGWALTIAGDMIFFSVIMVSTLWLNSVLGNGTMAAVLVTFLILIVPSVAGRVRRRKSS